MNRYDLKYRHIILFILFVVLWPTFVIIFFTLYLLMLCF